MLKKQENLPPFHVSPLSDSSSSLFSLSSSSYSRVSPTRMSLSTLSCPFLSIPLSQSRNGMMMMMKQKKKIISSRYSHFRAIRASAVQLEPSFTAKKMAAEVSAKLKGTSIFLVGMSGNMKTSTGKILSEALRYYYFDSDGLIEQAAGGKSSAKEFREKDEEGYRNSETEVLKQLSSMGRLVVCAGDGAVQSSTNLALLRDGISLWIDIPLDLLAKEAIANIDKCPQLWGISSSNSFSEVLVKLTEVYEQMREGYATADATVSLQKVASQLDYVDMEAVTADDMTIEAFKEIEKLTRVKKMMEDAAMPF